MADEFKVAFQRFAKTVPLNSPDYVLVNGPVKFFHGMEKHTPAEWKALVEAVRDRPV